MRAPEDYERRAYPRGEAYARVLDNGDIAIMFLPDGSRSGEGSLVYSCDWEEAWRRWENDTGRTGEAYETFERGNLSQLDQRLREALEE